MNVIGSIFLLAIIFTFSDAYAIRCFVFNCDDSGSDHTKDPSPAGPSIETQHFGDHDRPTTQQILDEFHDDHSTQKAFHVEEGSDRTTQLQGEKTTSGVFLKDQDKSTPLAFDKERSTPENIVKDFDHTKDTTQHPFTRKFNRKHSTTESS
ncbi:unnamed protein product, partial [Mesorhabditis belari]|uniref:Secreted protein n=1 Tax=Mesorhabditis belari TaxID=2138241 RepID=A0AAF3J3Z5_9BILA